MPIHREEHDQRSVLRGHRMIGWPNIVLVLLCLLCSSSTRAKVIERVVAVVNNEILLLSDLNERLGPMVNRLQQIRNPQLRQQEHQKLRRQMLDNMIDEHLIKQEASKLKITVSDQDLERAVADVMSKNNLTRTELEAALKQEGKSIEAYKNSILRPQLLRLRVLNVQVRSRVSVSDDEMKALYQKNLRDLGVETKVRASHIFVAIPADATARQIAERKRYAEKLLVKARQKGADFAELARKYSQDSVTRNDGGDLGYFGRGTLPASVEDVVFSMKTGEVKGPLRAERGFHLIKLVDLKRSSARPFEEVKEELYQQIYSQKLERATKAWLTEVRKRSFVDIKL